MKKNTTHVRYTFNSDNLETVSQLATGYQETSASIDLHLAALKYLKVTRQLPSGYESLTVTIETSSKEPQSA